MQIKLFTSIFAILFTFMLFFMSCSGYADGGGPSVCERTAHKMQHACRADSRDDRITHISNCLNISDSDNRHTCVSEARDEFGENLEECGDVREARLDACDLLDEDRYDPDLLLDAANSFIDPDDVPEMYAVNPYVSIAAGHTYVLRAGEEGEETVIVHVTEESREIQGVLCRIVVDIVVEVEEEEGKVEYTAVEVTQDWFAQDEIGNVYYCGEVSENYEDGVLRDIDGSFESGIEFAKAGVLIKAFPVVGESHRQEFSLGEAEDIVQYTHLSAVPGEEEGGENEAFPCAPGGCLRTFDFAPIDPESTEFKYYAAGIGFVLAVSLEEGEVDGEREELLCVGDSLEILESESCEIEELDDLLEQICELSPVAFCDEDDED